MSDLNISVKNLENQLDYQEQYSRRNCILIHGLTETQDENTDDISLRTINEHLELELTEKELDRTHRINNQKSGNKRPRPINVKFARYNTRRKVFVNKKGLMNIGISITVSLAKHSMQFFKTKNEFGFNNVWTADGRICSYDEVVIRYILTNYCGFLHYGKHKIESFFNFVFLGVMVIQLHFICKYILSFSDNVALIFYFELILCFEAVFKNSYLICYFFLIRTFLL